MTIDLSSVEYCSEAETAAFIRSLQRVGRYTKAGFIRFLQKQTAWRLCPYGCWTELDAAGVIFDGYYRPIVRVRPGGATEIVASDAFIRFRRERFFHSGFGSTPKADTLEIITTIIATYELAPELRRRLELLRHKALPRWKRN